MAHDLEVVVGRRGRVVGHEQAREGGRQPLAGLQRPRMPSGASRGCARAGAVGTAGRRPAPRRACRCGRPSRGRRGRRWPRRPPGSCRRARTTGCSPDSARFWRTAIAVPKPSPCNGVRSRYWLTYSSLVVSASGAARATSCACTTSTSRAAAPVVAHLDVPRPRRVQRVEGEGHPPPEAAGTGLGTGDDQRLRRRRAPTSPTPHRAPARPARSPGRAPTAAAAPARRPRPRAARARPRRSPGMPARRRQR